MPATPASEVLDLLALVAYQDGSVVSRQIGKTEGGNVTLFAFDAGQELSEHTAPYDALVHVLEGQLELHLAGKPFRVNAGQAVLMPANVPHALKALTKFKMLLTMLKG